MERNPYKNPRALVVVVKYEKQHIEVGAAIAKLVRKNGILCEHVTKESAFSKLFSHAQAIASEALLPIHKEKQDGYTPLAFTIETSGYDGGIMIVEIDVKDITNKDIRKKWRWFFEGIAFQQPLKYEVKIILAMFKTNNEVITDAQMVLSELITSTGLFTFTNEPQKKTNS